MNTDTANSQRGLRPDGHSMPKGCWEVAKRCLRLRVEIVDESSRTHVVLDAERDLSSMLDVDLRAAGTELAQRIAQVMDQSGGIGAMDAIAFARGGAR